MHDSAEHPELAMAADAGVQKTNSEFVLGLLHWLRIARYRHVTIVRAVCVSLMLGSVYYAVAPRYYRSTAKLLIIQRDQDQLASMGEQPSLDNTIATHAELITSPVVVQDAIEHLLPEHRIDLRNTPPTEWSDMLAHRLSTTTTRKTNFIQVSYQSLSPEAAAAVVSAVVQSYLEFVEGTHKGTATEVLNGLTHELDEVKQFLAMKQEELKAFHQRVGQLTVRKDDGIVDPTIQQALRLNDALMQVRETRLNLQTQLAVIQQAIRAGGDLQPYLAGLEETVGKQMMTSALGLTPEDLSLIKDQQQKLFEAQTELQSLTQYYGPAHPKVAELTERIRSTENYLASYRANTGERLTSFSSRELGPIVETILRQSVAQADLKERELDAMFQQARTAAVQESGDLVDLETREREVERLENQQDILLGKIANIDLHQLQAPIQATVVQEPLPDDRPSSPQLRLVIVGALLGGLVVGGMIVYVQDVLDDRFASPEEITAQLGVPVLAMIRQLEPVDGIGVAGIHTYLWPNAAETESFRTLRTALTLGAGTTNRLAISSAEPSDGKTTVAANLAVAFAQAGKKTLVIDADLRKPGMTTLLGLKGCPGLADVLQSAANPSEIAPQLIVATELAGLDVLPAGPRQHYPAELLSGPRLSELLAWAETCYDRVLVDCPPVLAVSDAQIVGRLVDGAILVVQPERNHRRLVVRACECFKATGGSVLGVVANGLSPLSDRGYGYGYGYGYAYSYGEDEEEDDSDTVSTISLPQGDDRRSFKRRAA